MVAYNLSSFAGAGAQFFDSNGDPLVGGKIYTYVAGTTTAKATYTTNTGAVANTNPIILDSAGRTPNEIWLEVGVQYKFILQTSTNVLIGTYDNLPAINDPYSINSLLSNVTGTNTIAATATPTLTAYAAGQVYSFIAANTNTSTVTISIDGLTAKSVTKNGATALSAGDIRAGMLCWVEYDGVEFQLINPASGFPSGTAMLFQQTAAPTGWTKSVAHDNKALRVVSGIAGSGGTTAFTSVFTARTIAEANLPPHTHTVNDPGHQHRVQFIIDMTAAGSGERMQNYTTGAQYYTTNTQTTGITLGNTGSGTAMDFAVQYVDLIIATKD